MNSASPLYLIDASIYIFQAYFSPYNEVSDDQGEDISAIVGFIQFLLSLQRRERPSFGAIAMDNALFTGFRHQLSQDYKSNRELPDENLARQLGLCADSAMALGWPVFASEEFEADDIIGTLAERSRATRPQSHTDGVCIVSRDKDLAQLIKEDSDIMWDYSGNKRRSRAEIEAELGLPTTAIPDYLGLVGDAVDCIAGVPGVGPVKAKALLSHFGDIETMFENLAEVAQLSFRGAKSLASTLSTFEEQALLCKKLATIVREPECCREAFSLVDHQELQLSDPRPLEFAALLREAGLPSGMRQRFERAADALLESRSQ